MLEWNFLYCPGTTGRFGPDAGEGQSLSLNRETNE